MQLYLVRWKQAFYYYEDESGFICRQHPSRSVRVFATLSEAQDFKLALERGEIAPPAGANPFIAFRALARGRRFGIYSELATQPAPVIRTLSDMTDFPESIFFDWVRDCGYEPPEVRATRNDPSFRDWDAWWEQHAATMTVEHKKKIWQALHKLEFYEIATVQLEE